MTATWRVRLAATRAEAAAVPHTIAFADRADPPTLVVDEPDPARPDAWTLDAYFAEEPTAADRAALAELAPSATGAEVEQLDDADWVTQSQAGFAPVRAGRFVVHTAAQAAAVRTGDVGLAIEAGLAFGTGQHATTRGCLVALDALARHPGRFGVARGFDSIADLGTGTGVLALAAHRAWPRAQIVASDIDPQATAVAAGNLAANAARRGRGAGRIELVTAAGLADRRLAGRFDLIVANILAGPLVDLAGPVARALNPGGIVVLAGLLDEQARRVAAAYAARGCRQIGRINGGDWRTLILRRG